MQTMFTGFSDNGEITNDSQNICLLFQKVQNPILTQIKASLRVSYDLDQANTVTYNFISDSLAVEATSLGYHTPQGVADVNTCGKKAPESGVKGAGGAIFTWFYPNCSKLLDRDKIYIFDERERLNMKGRGNKNRAGLHLSSPKINRIKRSNARSHIWKPSVNKSKKREAQARKQMNLRTMRETSLVSIKPRSSNRGQTASLGVSCSIGYK